MDELSGLNADSFKKHTSYPWLIEETLQRVCRSFRESIFLICRYNSIHGPFSNCVKPNYNPERDITHYGQVYT